MYVKMEFDTLACMMIEFLCLCDDGSVWWGQHWQVRLKFIQALVS